MKKLNFSLRKRLVLFVFSIMLFSYLTSLLLFELVRWVGLFRPFFTSRALTILWLFSMSGLIGTGATNWLGRLYLSPITQLREASERVARGDFTVRVTEREKGEVSQLQKSFNSMVEQLGSIEMFRNDFINSFSHEFKTPMVSIQGFARQLQREDITDAERREYAAIIVDECQRLTRLATNILKLSNLDHPQGVMEHAPFRLDEQLRGCILLLEKQWSAKQLDMDIDLQDVMCDLNSELLSEVWVNLLSNAVKFTGEGGRVSVRLRADQSTARVQIADTGIGMSAEALPHIFDKFYQGDSSHHYEGNGLGLPLVKRIVELFDGVITVESREGEGSLFTVELPLRQ